MEILSNKRRNSIVAVALSASALAGCSIDSYLTDSSNVQCDEKRTEVNLSSNGIATFIVHGKHKGDVATVKVRRDDNDASVNVSGDITGPPQQLKADGFTKPTPVVNGAELSAFGAGGAWVIDVRKDTVVIQGTCDGM
jgi:hypothetical protein